MKDGSITNTSVPVTPKAEADTAQRSPATNTSQQSAAPKPPAQAQQGQPQTPEQKQAAVEARTKVLDAKRILARDGWEPDEIAALPEDKLLAKAEHRGRAQAEVDRLGTEHAQLKRQMVQPRAEDGKFAVKEVPAAGQQAAAKPGDPAAQAAAQGQPLSDNPQVDALLREAEGSLGKPAAQLLGKIANVLAAENQARGQNNDAFMRSQLIMQGQQLFAEKYPEQSAADPDSFAEVQKAFAANLNSGRYSETQFPKAWTDALYLVHGPPNEVQNAQRGMLARSAAAVAGHVDAGSQRSPSAQPTAMTTKEKLQHAAKLMAANPNGNLDDMRTRLSGIIG